MKVFNFQFSIFNSQRGQAVMTAVIFFLFISLLIVFGLAGPAVRELKISQGLISSKKSYFLAEAGEEDLVYRIIKAKNYSNQEVIMLNGFYATTTARYLLEDDKREIVSRANVRGAVRKVRLDLIRDTKASFHAGVQVGEGGLIMENNSLVTGNVYSNGSVQAFNSNEIKGDVVSAGPSGSIDGVYATGTAYAYNILNSTIDGDAYYQTISNTIVGGSFYPDSPDQSLQDLPISDETIGEWEQAAATAIISSPCPYEIKSDLDLGPAKITCDVEISGSPIITLTGMLWITGSLDIQNTAVIRLDSSLGERSLAIIVDNPDDRLTSSKIILQNSVEFQNSGTEGSYILLISQNNSAENGGSETAIDIKNSVRGELLVYAGHGEILLQNSGDLKEVTAHRVHLQNLAKVVYQTGLASLLFETGPSGGWQIDSWQEF